jgi:hypothetical protein
MDNT